MKELADFRNGHKSRQVNHTVNTQQGHHQLHLYRCMSKRPYDLPLMVDQVRKAKLLYVNCYNVVTV